MKKILIVNSLVLLLALVAGGRMAQAITSYEYTGPADKLEIQLAKIEVSQDGGSSWTTVWTGTSITLDCKSAEVISLVTGIQILPGDYDCIRLSFHNSVVRGVTQVNPEGNFVWTTNGGGSGVRCYYTDPTDDGTNYELDCGDAFFLQQDQTIDTSGETLSHCLEGVFTISLGQTTTIELYFPGSRGDLVYTVEVNGGVIVSQGFTRGLPCAFTVTVK